MKGLDTAHQRQGTRGFQNHKKQAAGPLTSGREPADSRT